METFRTSIDEMRIAGFDDRYLRAELRINRYTPAKAQRAIRTLGLFAEQIDFDHRMRAFPADAEGADDPDCGSDVRGSFHQHADLNPTRAEGPAAVQRDRHFGAGHSGHETNRVIHADFPVTINANRNAQNPF